MTRRSILKRLLSWFRRRERVLKHFPEYAGIMGVLDR